eukprot:146910_1
MFHNIRAKHNEKVQDPIYQNMIFMEDIAIMCMAETKVKNLSFLKKPRKLKNYKYHSVPATDGFNTNKTGTSNGYNTIIKKNVLPNIRSFMTSIGNPYLTKYCITDLHLVVIFVYIPPLKSTDKYKHPTRERIIKQIYRDWAILLNIAKSLKLLTVSMGDFNGRMPDLTNDHAANFNGLNYLQPFIELNNLNLISEPNKYTNFNSTGGKSIIDLILLSDDAEWEGFEYETKVISNRFKSDHTPIILKLKCIDKQRTHTKFIGPKYTRIRIKDDIEHLDEAIHKMMDQLTTLPKLIDEAKSLNWNHLERDEAQKRIDKVYNLFTKVLIETLIDNDCLVMNTQFIINNSKNNQDDEVQQLLMHYERCNETIDQLNRESIRIQNNQGNNHMIKQLIEQNTIELEKIESKLIARANQIKLDEHNDFIETANTYHKDEDERRLFNLINKLNDNADAIIQYNNKTLFTDIDIMIKAEEYYRELYTESNPLEKYSMQRLQELLDESYNDDIQPQNDEYTITELRAIKLIKTKATGLDRINYLLIKRLIYYDRTANLLLDIVNIIHKAAILPTQLRIEKIAMLKKKEFVEIFRDFRGITIANNIKSVISKLRYGRTKPLYENNTHTNDAAYRTGCGTELLAYAQHICVIEVVKEEETAFIGQTDLDQAFDNCHRIKLCIDAASAGIAGMNLRLLCDDIMHKEVRMSYKNLFTEQIKTSKGLPQGGDDSGQLFNTYTKNTTKEMLRIHKTIVYEHNISTTNYSDDRMKITSNKQDLQDMFINENILNHRVNFSTNPLKSSVIVYAKNKQTIKRMQQMIINNAGMNMDDAHSPNIKLDGKTIQFRNEPIKNLGIWRDYTNINDPTSYHIEYKVNRMEKLQKKLFAIGLIGGSLELEIQKKNYVMKVRAAMSYGLRVIRIQKRYYKQLDRMQTLYLATILDGPFSADHTTCEIVLGIPPWSLFIMRIKLKMYYRIQTTTINIR